MLTIPLTGANYNSTFYGTKNQLFFFFRNSSNLTKKGSNRRFKVGDRFYYPILKIDFRGVFDAFRGIFVQRFAPCFSVRFALFCALI